MRRLIHLTNVAPVRDFLWARAAKQFLRERAEAGVLIRDRDALTAIGEIKTLLVDTRQVMEGWNAVRMAAAPLFACDLDKFRRQGSWMMLTAGVALGCADAKPLETFARELNFESERMAKQFPKVDVFAYDDARRVETTVHRDAGGFRAYTKGEPEAVLARCLSVLDGR